MGKAKPMPIRENLVGKIFSNSFGYDMTLNTYYKVIRQTAKMLYLQECYCIVSDDYGQGNGKSIAGELKPDGEVVTSMRMRKTYLRNGEEIHSEHWTCSKYPNYLVEWDGQPDYYNSWD